MARKKEKKIKVKAEKLPKKDEQLDEQELKKVTGGVGKVTPDIDCWKPKVEK